jgi:peptidoglycan/xylan/chitin deacetylase (PgdA/CDA1 family)
VTVLPSRLASRLALLAGTLLVLLSAAGLGEAPPPISITVNGRNALVAAGSSLGDVARSLGLDPADGRLLDVQGHVLERHADPGTILLDGLAAPRRARLADGDRVTVLDGRDRTEGTRRVRTRLPGRQPGDPQFSLATARMLRVDTLGRVSGILVRTAYRPLGRSRRPPEVALTFDDGPWPRTTRQILDVLHRMRARATFFVVGYLARRYPGMVRDELRAGMVVANHSWDHPEPFDVLTPRRIRAEMRDASDLLRRRFGVRARLFRPPGGSSSPKVVTAASELGMRVVNWNVDPRDWVDGVSSKAIVRSVLSQVEPGSIVDMHDGGGDQTATVRALPAIIRGIRRMGLKLVVLR